MKENAFKFDLMALCFLNGNQLREQTQVGHRFKGI